MKERLFTLLAATLVCLAGCDRKTDDGSSSQGTLPLPTRPPTPTPAATVTPSTTPQKGADGAKTPAAGTPGQAHKKKEKGPTNITAREVNFDARTNIAVFTHTVHLDNPDFRVDCDKLTAFLKSDKKPAGSPKTAGNKKNPKPPASKASGTPPPRSGLDRAIAESTGESRVIITQDKKDEDGNILVENYSIGKADRANYNANTKETVLSGTPDVVQGLNRCFATDPSTKIFFVQDGPMRTVGPNKSILKEQSNDNAQGATEVTSLESTFDSAKHVAVFTGSVIANNPQFNVVCDKLTGYLKHGDKTSGSGATAGSDAASKTPATGKATGGAPAEQEGGLEKAVAETTSERRVLLTQDKKDASGNVIAHNYSIGHADKAVYDAATKNTVLSGNPDVIQGSDRCIAKSPSTIIILNQDNHMKAIGPHTMVIVDQAETKYPGSDMKLPKAVSHSDMILQAVLVTRGTREPDVPGMAVYTGNTFKVTKSLRGTAGGDTVTVKIVVLDRDDAHELLPEVGTEYILFVAPQIGQEQTVIKMMPYNEDTLKAVTDALSAPR